MDPCNNSAPSEVSPRVASDSLPWTPYDVALQAVWGTLVVGVIIGVIKAWRTMRERARIGAEYTNALASNPSHPPIPPDHVE